MIERAKTMVLAVLALAGWIVTVPDSAQAFFCRYPRTRLSGVADVGGSQFVRLDLDLRFNGAECEVEIAGRGRCRPVAHRTLGVTFTVKGECPSPTFVIDNASYVRVQRVQTRFR